jgi:hypothetical protein
MTHTLEGREAPQAAAMGAIRSSSGPPDAVHLRRARGETTNRAKRRGVVEVAAAFGLPLLPLGTVAVIALAGPLDLGRAPLQAGPDLVGLQLGDRPLLALGVSQLRWRSRPVTITRSPLERDSARCSPGRATH